MMKNFLCEENFTRWSAWNQSESLKKVSERPSSKIFFGEIFRDSTSVFWKQNRIKTFNNWPFKTSDKCNAKNMVAAGFYVIGNIDEPDLVECFICGKQLDGWEPHDDPWDEHVKHQSNCSFVQLNKPDEKDWTVHEMYNLYKKYQIKKYMNELNKIVFALKDEAVASKSDLLSAYKTSQKNKKSTD